ncbi:MAG: asparagine synthase (glutamine-hydrolyzing) [Gemmatimonadales bacterium]|nr:asparagine synthase (glutamine-hydrolyzing) [Gemmatimonadales bacterium]
MMRLGGGSLASEHGLVKRMTGVLSHRGPDDKGIWGDDRVLLGHRRLSVIDLSPAGRQPMANEDGTIQIVFNGEIYNFRDLRARFELDAGHCFRSRTDTEVLVHLFEELGPDMARHLNGMYAFAIWDARRAELHLARDPYGVKPLFIQQDETHVRFGSEIKAILEDPRVPRRICLQALHDYLTFDYIPGTQTAFDGIVEIPPGHWVTIGPDGFSSERFWDVSYDVDDSMTLRQAADTSLQMMDQAVARQLVADVPVGVMLSGGLDSSAIVALMHRHVREPIHTYSVGFQDRSFNELPYARMVAREFQTIAQEVVVTPDRVRDLLPAYLRFIDEPYADGSAIPTYLLCQLAREEVVVVLSGEGGDEAFAGYDTHAAYRATQWFRRIPRAIRHGLLAPLVRRLPVSHKKLSLEFKLKRFLGGHDLPPAEAHLWWRFVLSEAEKQALYSPEVLERLVPEPSVRHFTETFQKPGPPDVLARLLRIDSEVFLPDDLMIKNDRMSMAHSLEARVPFTDPDLTNFMSRVPSRLKLPGLKRKHVMRTALRGVLPDPVVKKKKVGLEMPYSRWLRDELKDILTTYLGRDRILASGLFVPEAVQALIDDHLAGRRDNGRALWGLLNYMMWLELYGATI